MAITIVRGVTFVSGGTVTAGNLNALVDDAAVTNVDRGQADSSTAFFITRGTTPPSGQVSLEPWVDSVGGHVFAKVGSDGSVSSLPLATTMTLSTGTATIGTLLKVPSSATFGQMAASVFTSEAVVGMAAHVDQLVLNGASSMACRYGTLVTAGDQLKLGDAGLAEPTTAAEKGGKNWGIALEDGVAGDLKWISLWH